MLFIIILILDGIFYTDGTLVNIMLQLSFA